MKMVPLGELITAAGPRAKADSDLPVYSVTKHAGFVPSLEYFKKQVFSRDTSGYRIVKPGEFAYATIHLDEGSIGIAPEGALISPMYTAFRLNTAHADPSFILRYMKSPAAMARYELMGNGAVHRRKAIPLSILKNLLVPLPQLTEQRRIASILDQADALRTKRRQQLAYLESLPQALFEQRFRGSARNRPFDEVLSSIETGVSPQCEARPAMNEEWGVLKLSAVTGGKYKSHENKAFLGDNQLLTKAQVRPGDLLMTRKNTPDLVGQVAYVTDTPERLALPDLIFRLRLSEGSDARFYQTLLMSRSVRRDIQRLAGGAAASMSNIAGSRLKTLIIPDVPTHEQREFSAELVKIESLRTSIESASKESDEMFATLQSRAFRGEL